MGVLEKWRHTAALMLQDEPQCITHYIHHISVRRRLSGSSLIHSLIIKHFIDRGDLMSCSEVFVMDLNGKKMIDEKMKDLGKQCQSQRSLHGAGGEEQSAPSTPPRSPVCNETRLIKNPI